MIWLQAYFNNKYFDWRWGRLTSFTVCFHYCYRHAWTAWEIHKHVKRTIVLSTIHNPCSLDCHFFPTAAVQRKDLPVVAHFYTSLCQDPRQAQDCFGLFIPTCILHHEIAKLHAHSLSLISWIITSKSLPACKHSLWCWILNGHLNITGIIVTLDHCW